MAKIQNGFETTDGTVYKKKEDTAGRTYYVREGDGRISQEAFAGAKAHFKYAVNVGSPVDPRDPTSEAELPPEIRDATSTQELENITNIPFTREGFNPIAVDSETDGNVNAEQNRFWGFYEQNFEKYDNKTEAAKDYLKFRREIEAATDAQARAIIKSRYNIGGS